MKKNQENQTQFTQEGALYESGQEELLQTASSRLKEDSFVKSKKGKLIIGLSILLFALLALLFISSSNKEKPQSAPQQNQETEIEEIEDSSPLRLQLEDLQNKLEQSDPADKDTPFPNVNMDIRIEEKKE
ncbi:MAG: hypothetical protein U9O78_00085 [Patescibacteria group bacterium]|nr:hypothetical protein [Patescibacteria group bacterium]